MPQYIVSLKDKSDQAAYDAAKKHVTDQGGEVVDEFKLIKGFTYKVPDDKVNTLESNDKINVEVDGEVKTQ